MSVDPKGALGAPLGDSPNFSATEEATGIIARNLPARPTQSVQLWGFGLYDGLPKQLSSDGIEAVVGSYERIRCFVAEQYAMFTEEGLGSVPNELAQRSKHAYLSTGCDLIALVHAGKTVGIMVGAPEDWSSYYVRVFALLPEYQRPGLTRRFVRECLFEPLARHGVERVVADTNPSNIAMTRLLGELEFFVTGNQLTDRWGALIRYTKFLDPACEQQFRRRFGGGAPRRKRRDNEEEVP
jgi:ribosomal protein S18 acetylase RimI-like enzyme